MEGTIICKKIYVDRWETPKTQNCCYFLSQIVPDIDFIINSSWKYPIYSSEPNLRALACFTNVNKELLRPLAFQEKTFITIADFTFHVTVINTYSLTGSVIYHFSCNGKEYLYCGQINITPHIIYNPYIINLGKMNIIDTLIVDTSLAHIPIDFSLESAAEQIENILSENINMKVVMSTSTFGMEDLLLEVASKGFSVYTGNTRSTFLKFQGADHNFTRSKFARLRPVNKCYCMNIEDCYRRYTQKGILTLIPSPFYTLEEAKSLRKLGIHIIFYADKATPRALYHLITNIRPIKLKSSTKMLDVRNLKPYLKFCRKPKLSTKLSTIFRDYKYEHDKNAVSERNLVNEFLQGQLVRDKTPDPVFLEAESILAENNSSDNILLSNQNANDNMLNNAILKSDNSDLTLHHQTEVSTEDQNSADINRSFIDYIIETKTYFNHKQPHINESYKSQSFNKSYSKEVKLLQISEEKSIIKESRTSSTVHSHEYTNTSFEERKKCAVLLKRLRINEDDEVLTSRQKRLKNHNKQAFDNLSHLTIPALEEHQKMHLFTKHKIQFMDDNYIDPIEMSKNLYRFHIQHHLACIDKLREEMVKVGKSDSNKKL